MDLFPSRRGKKGPTPGRREHGLPHKWEERIHYNIQMQKQNCTFLKDLSESANARVTPCDHLSPVILKEAGALQKTGN